MVNSNVRDCADAKYKVVIGRVRGHPETRTILAGEEILHAIIAAGIPVRIELDMRDFDTAEDMEAAAVAFME